jgi:hypothetical protein
MNTKFMLARRVSRNVCLTAFLSLPLVMMPTYAQAEESSGTADAFAQTQSAQPAADKSIDGGQPRLEGQPTLEPVLFHDASVSMPSLEPSPFIKKSVIAPMTRLKGYADVSEYTPDPSQLIQDLVDVAVARDKEKDLLEQSAKFHNKTWTKVLGRSKGMLQYATSYQGFERRRGHHSGRETQIKKCICRRIRPSKENGRSSFADYLCSDGNGNRSWIE